jgi:hypothetical protein
MAMLTTETQQSSFVKSSSQSGLVLNYTPRHEQRIITLHNKKIFVAPGTLKTNENEVFCIRIGPFFKNFRLRRLNFSAFGAWNPAPRGPSRGRPTPKNRSWCLASGDNFHFFGSLGFYWTAGTSNRQFT